jgi:hypothetical protein
MMPSFRVGRALRTGGGALVLAVLLATSASAAGLECGAPPAGHPAADAALTGAITSAHPDPGALRAAFARLRRDGVSNGTIVDHAVAAYCPLVAADGSLPLDRKREAVRRFAAEVTASLYDPGQDSAVILSLPLAPSLVERVDAAAARAKTTRDGWILGAIEAGLAGR